MVQKKIPLILHQTACNLKRNFGNFFLDSTRLCAKQTLRRLKADDTASEEDSLTADALAQSHYSLVTTTTYMICPPHLRHAAALPSEN